MLFRSVTARVDAEEQLRQAAVHDALTAIRADSWMRRSALELGRRKRNPR